MKFTSALAFLLQATLLVSNDAFSMQSTNNRMSTSSLHSTAVDFDLKSYVDSKQPAINQALEDAVISKEPQTEKILESMRYSLMAGGKRIRPVLCLAAAEMFAPSPEYALDVAMPTMTALEMLHTMSLIHDDLPCLDNDDLRRGKPTNHVKYGEDIAILAGDALLSTAFQQVSSLTPRDKVNPIKILDVLTRLGQKFGAKGVNGGQVMDLICEGKGNDVTIEELKWIHTHKTAALMEVSVATGAILGGATPTEVEACEKFALNVGLAFQVADDILDCTQTTEELGKTAGKDDAVDKTTYPKLLGLDGARDEAERLVTEAKQALEPFGDRAIPLLALADYIINRKN